MVPAGSITWNPGDSNLCISYGDNSLGIAPNTASTTMGYTKVWYFSTAGTLQVTTACQSSSSTTLNAGCTVFLHGVNYFISGARTAFSTATAPTVSPAATMRSAAVLGAPITKTSSDTMRIVYELDFSGA
jgi:hypothetical protein